MKMRFTDIDKWRKLWFRGLCPEAKLLLLYLFDNCGDAGVIEDDPMRFAFDTGMTIDDIACATRELTGLGKLRNLDNRYLFLPSFVKFQYPKGLKHNYNPHKGVWREIQKHELSLDELGINPSLDQALTKASKNKDKIKIKIKDKDRIKKLWLRATGGNLSPRISFDEERLGTLDQALAKHSLLQIVRVWQEAGRSDFLTNRHGDNRNGWQATFDWLHKPANWKKVTEGAYENRTRRVSNGF